MVRIMEILVALNALGGIATFLGIRLATRKARETTARGLEKIGIDISPEEESVESEPTAVVEEPPAEEGRKGRWSGLRRHKSVV